MTEESILPKGYKFCECGLCDIIIPIYDKRGRFRKFYNGHQNRGENNPAFNGWKINCWKGYVAVRKVNYHKQLKTGYVKEHRLVYEEFYKCCLLEWTDIHHINGVKNDNQINNLLAIMHNKHKKIHKIDTSNRKCLYPECENPTKTYISKEGYPYWFKYKNGFICLKCHGKRTRRLIKHDSSIDDYI